MINARNEIERNRVKISISLSPRFEVLKFLINDFMVWFNYRVEIKRAFRM